MKTSTILVLLTLCMALAACDLAPVDKAIDAIPSPDNSVVSGAALVLDVALRALKTKKPLSIAWLIVDGLNLVAKGASKVASLMDKLFGQRTAEAPKA